MAQDHKFSVRVALKLAAAIGSRNAGLVSRFRREARIGYLVGQQPGIVRALDWGKQGDLLFLVLDLVPGARPLDLRRGTPAQRLQFMREAISLVCRIHRAGIVHRDLKPSNFLRSSRRRLHLTDFGEAKSLSDRGGGSSRVDLTQTGAMVGTPLFMPPEQYEDAKRVDERADVYALGVMLYFAIAGVYPYAGESPLQIMAAQLRAQAGDAPAPPPLHALIPDCPLDLSAAVSEAIALDPARRPRSASALQQRLQASNRETTGRRPRPAPVLDADGFAPIGALLPSDVAVLKVVAERPVRGKTRYQGLATPLPATRDRLILGRDPQVDVCLRLPTVGKRHARLELIDGRWHVVDLGSRNGCRLNGRRLEPERTEPLRAGDRLQIARHLTFELVTPAVGRDEAA